MIRTTNLAAESGKNSRAKTDNDYQSSKFAAEMMEKFKKELKSFIITNEQKTRQQITEAFFKALIQLFQELKGMFNDNQLNSMGYRSSRIDEILSLEDNEEIYKYLFKLARDIETSLYQANNKQAKKDTPYFSQAKILLIYLKKPNQMQLKLDMLTRTRDPSELCQLTEQELMSQEQKNKIEQIQAGFMKDREIVVEKIYLKSHKGDIELNADVEDVMPVALQSDQDQISEHNNVGSTNGAYHNDYTEASTTNEYDFSKGFNLLDYKRFLEKKIREILNERTAENLVRKLDHVTEMIINSNN